MQYRRDPRSRSTSMWRAGVAAAALAPLVIALPASGATTRIAGRDRYETSALVADAAFAVAARIVVARGDDFPDALAAAGIAGVDGGSPILLTSKAGFDDATSALIDELGVEEAVVLGSEAVVGAEVERDLRARGIGVRRVAGADRYHTAALAAAEVVEPGAIDGLATIVLASGESFADALAVGPLAFARQLPIALTTRDVLPDATRALLAGAGVEQVVVVGGTAAVSAAVVAEVERLGLDVVRVAGPTRHDTATAVADLFVRELGAPTTAVVARGDTFPDALASAPLAGGRPAPLLLAGGTAASAWLAEHDVDDVTLLGPATLEPATPARWDPAIGDTWHLQLNGELVTDVDVDVYDIDLFDTPASTIEALQTDGRRVICYLSAGSWEEWRPDAGDWPESVLGQPLDGWPGERWVDVRALDVLGPLLEARFDLAVAKGCDAVDPDNIDGFDGHDTGFPLTSGDALAFNRFLVGEGHERGLAVGLKNGLTLVADLADEVDFAVNEQCVQFEDCHVLAPYDAHGAPVFGVEYEGSLDEVCAATADVGAWLLADISLDGRAQACRTG